MAAARWDRVRQRATASGHAQVVQVRVAGDFVGSPPAQEALWALRDAPAVLVGRGEQEAELARLLGPGPDGARVAVIAGLAGVGKSALALTAAQQALAAGTFPGGVLFVELRGYRAGDAAVGVEQALGALLGELGVADKDLPATLDGRLARYRSELAEREAAGRRVLIVADDASEAGQVRDLVPPGGDAHRLLVTSRDRLVAADFPARVLALDELAAVPAEELVAARLRGTWPEDPRPAAEPEALAAVARHCGGLPLALTVAAAVLARDPGLGIGAYAAQLADARGRLERLSPPDPAGLPAGVRAAFDVSYARLPAAQARLLRLLPVHPGPHCTTAVAVALVHEGDGDIEWSSPALAATRELLAGLAGAGWLTEQPVGSGRWRMHDLVRLYAKSAAAASEYRDAAARLFLGLVTLAHHASERWQARTGEPGYEPFADVAGATQWLAAEVDTVLWAVRLAAGAEATSAVLLVAECLMLYLSQRGRPVALAELFRMAVEAARRGGEPELEVLMLNRLSSVLSSLGLREEARAVQQEIATVLEERGEVRAETARQMGVWADQLHSGGRLEEAEQARQEALRMARSEGDRGLEADLLDEYAEALLQQKRTDEALGVREREVELVAALDDGLRMAAALERLAATLSEVGREEEAVGAYRRAVQLFQDHQATRLMAAPLRGLGDCLLALGRHELALAAYRDCLALRREAHESYAEALMAGHMGVLLVSWNRREEALPLLERACDLLGEVEEPTALLLRADALMRLRRRHEAEAVLSRAQEVYADMGDDRRLAAVAHMLRELRGRQGPGARARLRRWFRRSP
ncbi:tetratricopeptide repeat protein [Streptomyces antimicrobicus]|uniref:Tetratricopeptide repeat protein n=1 Tax=Streptomyces antimicrobicus TaxID=2883108 RepID=A0ABS8B314_9ACTN|nr:tetratricopeptide repeat protein [Streptomyces antimicrobicus]MCB5178982.1 tetratricopeptide repeat protein [Streptomyces antimicrobicus]